MECGWRNECLLPASAVDADGNDVVDSYAALGGVCLTPYYCGKEYVDADADVTLTMGDCPFEEGEACDNVNYFCYPGSEYDSS